MKLKRYVVVVMCFRICLNSDELEYRYERLVLLFRSSLKNDII